MEIRVVTTAVLTTVCLLSGCTHGSTHRRPTAVTTGRHPVSFDDGALRVTPVPDASPVVGRVLAARVLASTQFPSSAGLTPVLGSVTIVLPSPSGHGAKRELHLNLAWVYVTIQPPGLVSNCHGFGYSPGPIRASASRAWALIVNAKTGTAYEYLGAGAGSCDPLSAPRLRPAYLHMSVRFSLVRTGALSFTITTHLPPCGRVISTSLGPLKSQSIAEVPTGPCSGSASTLVQHAHGRFITHPYAPLGLVCWGNKDVAYGEPSDCVRQY